MKCIPLTKDYVAIVDDADYEYLARFQWYASMPVKSNTVYAVRFYSKSKRSISMHRELLKATGKQHVDHRNLCGIDNRRENLRLCTFQQNTQNRRSPQVPKTSRFKGVGYDRVWGNGTKNWRARLKTNKRILHLGWFDNEIDAAKAYNAAAIEHFGEFARLNEIPAE